MSNELTGVTLNKSYTDIIKEKIKQFMIETIPDDVLTKAIKDEYDSYFKSETNSWRATTPSSFRVLFVETANDLLKSKVTSYLEANITDDWQAQCKKVTDSFLLQHGKSMIDGLMTSLLAGAAEQFRQSIAQMSNNRY